MKVSLIQLDFEHNGRKVHVAQCAEWVAVTTQVEGQCLLAYSPPKPLSNARAKQYAEYVDERAWEFELERQSVDLHCVVPATLSAKSRRRQIAVYAEWLGCSKVRAIQHILAGFAADWQKQVELRYARSAA